MIQLNAAVRSNDEIMPGIHLIWLQAPQIARQARPGQFVMIRCGEGWELPMRRPISIHKTINKEQIGLLFQKVGKGTEWLSRRRKGDSLDLLGPLGNGFSIKPASGNLLMIAGGIGIAPLAFLAEDAIEKGYSVTLLTGAKNASCLYPGYMMWNEIQIQSATEDGSDGHRGLITDILPDCAPKADQVFACGPSQMYLSIADKVDIKEKSVQVSLEVRMGCGVGACYSCTVKTRQSLKQVCKDGPVFELSDILY